MTILALKNQAMSKDRQIKTLELAIKRLKSKSWFQKLLTKIKNLFEGKK